MAVVPRLGVATNHGSVPVYAGPFFRRIIRKVCLEQKQVEVHRNLIPRGFLWKIASL